MAPLPKKRRLNPNQPQEILFDPSSRADYLTGFHKRKQARIQHARETAAKREKEERVKERQQIREQRKKELEEHLKEVGQVMRKQNADMGINAETEDEEEEEEDEWAGIEEDGNDGESAKAGEDGVLVDGEDEYVDEDKYTTVTVEPMALSSADEEEGDEHEADGVTEKKSQAQDSDGASKKRIWSKDKPTDGSKPRKKKRQFRYETKAERQVTRNEQKRKSKAARARREKKKEK
jgi:ribosomal RNA-processing protein 17